MLRRHDGSRAQERARRTGETVPFRACAGPGRPLGPTEGSTTERSRRRSVRRRGHAVRSEGRATARGAGNSVRDHRRWHLLGLDRRTAGADGRELGAGRRHGPANYRRSRSAISSWHHPGARSPAHIPVRPAGPCPRPGGRPVAFPGMRSAPRPAARRRGPADRGRPSRRDRRLPRPGAVPGVRPPPTAPPPSGRGVNTFPSCGGRPTRWSTRGRSTRCRRPAPGWHVSSTPRTSAA